MTRHENPDDDKGAEATFAKKQGWQVTRNLGIGFQPPAAPWLVIPPIGVRSDPKLRWAFATVPGAWGAAAQRAGYRPLEPGPLVMRPSPTLKARQGRPAASVNVLRKDIT